MADHTQIKGEDPEVIQKHFEKFIDDMPPQLKHFAEEEHISQLMYGAFLGGYRRGMSITLLQIDKAFKSKIK